MNKFDLEERTTKFGLNIINFVKKLEQNSINKPLVSQIVRSATSVGANYSEANQAVSKKDFINKMAIAKKESNETKYWLRIIAETNGIFRNECRNLWQEAHELTLIFSKSIGTARTR